MVIPSEAGYQKKNKNIGRSLVSITEHYEGNTERKYLPEFSETFQAIDRQGKEERERDGEKNRERMKRFWGKQDIGKNMRDFTIFYSTPETLNKNIVQEL